MIGSATPNASPVIAIRKFDAIVFPTSRIEAEGNCKPYADRPRGSAVRELDDPPLDFHTKRQNSSASVVIALGKLLDLTIRRLVDRPLRDYATMPSEPPAIELGGVTTVSRGEPQVPSVLTLRGPAGGPGVSDLFRP